MLAFVFAIQIRLNLGYCCYRMNHLNEALQHYSHLLEDEPISTTIHPVDRAISLNCIAVVHAWLGQPMQAVEHLSHAISLACTGEKTRTVSLFLKNLLTLCSTQLDPDQKTLPSCKKDTSRVPLGGNLLPTRRLWPGC